MSTSTHGQASGRSPVFAELTHHIREGTNTFLAQQVSPWMSFHSGHFKIQRSNGRWVEPGEAAFSGTLRRTFWFEYGKPFLKDFIIQELERAANLADSRAIDRHRVVPEAVRLLGQTVSRVYREMRRIDALLLRAQAPVNEDAVPIDPLIESMNGFIDEIADGWLVDDTLPPASEVQFGPSPPPWWYEAIKRFDAFDQIDERKITTKAELRQLVELGLEVAKNAAIVPARLDGYDQSDFVTIVSKSDPDDWKRIGATVAAFRGSWDFMHPRQDWAGAIRRVIGAARRLGLSISTTTRDTPLSAVDLEFVCDEILRELEGTSSHNPSDSAAAANTGSNAPPWKARHEGGIPLRGWRAICKALNVKTTDTRTKALGRLNDATHGPIETVMGRPQVDRGELLAWIGDSKAQREAEEAARREQERAKEEPGEREGKRGADMGMHVTKRPGGSRTRLAKPKRRKGK